MKKVYIVDLSTGEYDDHALIPVKAFTNETKAKDFAEMANQWLISKHLHTCSNRDALQGENRYILAAQNPYHPECYIAYGGGDYNVYSLDLED